VQIVIVAIWNNDTLH